MGRRIAGGRIHLHSRALPSILFDTGSDKYASGLAKISAPIMLVLVALRYICSCKLNYNPLLASKLFQR